MPAARVAAGSLAGGLGAPQWLGSRCRAANAVAALLLAGGEPAAAFADNRTSVFLARGETEIPRGRGRVHLALPYRPGSAPPPPRVTLRARPQTIFFDQPLEVEARCDGPCDLRGLPASGRGLGTASLRRAGTVRLRIARGPGRHLAPRRHGRVPVVVHACPPAGDALASARIGVPARRRRPPPVARVVGLRAERRGKRVLVSWRTDRPAYRVEFTAVGRGARRSRPVRFYDYSTVEGRGRTRFALRIPARGARYVALTAEPRDRPRRRVTRVVRVR